MDGETVEESQDEASLREVFSLFDEGGDGAVNEHDMQRAFDLLKVELIPRDIKALFAGRGEKVMPTKPMRRVCMCSYIILELSNSSIDQRVYRLRTTYLLAQSQNPNPGMFVVNDVDEFARHCVSSHGKGWSSKATRVNSSSL